MLMVLHGNDGVHTHNRGSKDILGATTHYTPMMTIKHGTALKWVLLNTARNYKELQDTFKPSKCLKTLQGTTRYIYSCYKVVENTTRNYKVLLNQLQSS